MAALLLGTCAVGALVGLQLVLWRLIGEPREEDPNEYWRLAGSRRVVLSFFEHEDAWHVRATIELSPGEDAPRLELARRGARPVLAKWVGVLAAHELSDEALRGRFVCRVPENPRAFEALGRMKATLLGTTLDVRELKLDENGLSLVAAASRPQIDAITDLLERLVRAVLQGGGVTIRGEDAVRARCGFCHSELAAEALATVACERCSAVVHELCWAEHGCCPVLGCKGASPRRISSGGSASSSRGAAS